MGRYSVIAIACVALLTIAGLFAWQFYQIRTLNAAIENLEWQQVSNLYEKDDTIAPTVGQIQFIKGQAYSIEIDHVSYDGNGLHLRGFIGNATNLYISNLTLTFTVTKQVYEIRDAFDNFTGDKSDPFGFWLNGSSIGTAQSAAISSLAPGTRQDFDVTIPNVRQTSSGVRIALSFSGERYSYGP